MNVTRSLLTVGSVVVDVVLSLVVNVNVVGISSKELKHVHTHCGSDVVVSVTAAVVSRCAAVVVEVVVELVLVVVVSQKLAPTPLGALQVPQVNGQRPKLGSSVEHQSDRHAMSSEQLDKVLRGARDMTVSKQPFGLTPISQRPDVAHVEAHAAHGKPKVNGASNPVFELTIACGTPGGTTRLPFGLYLQTKLK